MSNEIYLPGDFDTHVDEAHTLGIVTGDGYNQENINIVDVLRSELLEFTSTEASTALPQKSLVHTVNVQEIVNYIGFASSVKGEAVLLSIFGGIQWVNMGGIYYPVGDYKAAAGSGTVLHRVPAKRSYQIEICINPATYAFGYVDKVKLLYGYLPDSRERVAR